MRVGLFTDALAHRSRADAFRFCAERGIADVELGVGGYSPAPHADLAALVASAGERERLLADLAGAGLALAALNASGNPLHPLPATAVAHDRTLRGAVELAALLGVERVVAMSGTPGGP